jgi:exopolysaccharide biosynthesis protein
VTESAYVLQALGARDAINLDGGGTSAMYLGGSYRVGPGRLLPNAIVLTKP